MKILILLKKSEDLCINDISQKLKITYAHTHNTMNILQKNDMINVPVKLKREQYYKLTPFGIEVADKCMIIFDNLSIIEEMLVKKNPKEVFSKSIDPNGPQEITEDGNVDVL